MKLPKIECEKCKSTEWFFNDGMHECKKCLSKISDIEMLRRLNQKFLKTSK